MYFDPPILGSGHRRLRGVLRGAQLEARAAYTGKITMSRNALLVLEVGLLLGFGLTFSVGANDTDLQQPRFSVTTLDSTGDVGQFTSVTMGTDGLGLISYHDVTNRTL